MHEGDVTLFVLGRRPSTRRAGGTGSARRRWCGTGIVVAALAGLNVAIHLVRSSSLWLGPVAAVALLAYARLSGLSWVQLGLGRDRLRSGGVWGAGAIAAVGVVYLAGVLLPATRPAFLDARYHLDVAGALLSALVVIPVGTVLLEEVAFRSVLWGMLARHMTAWRVVVISSVLFGLWHVLPSLHLAEANRGVSDAVGGRSAGVLVVLATVVFTALGGVVAGELRRRSGSLLASVGMHWATNALGVLVRAGRMAPRHWLRPVRVTSPTPAVDAQTALDLVTHRRFRFVRHYVRGLSLLGVVCGWMFFVVSLAPSLLPRSWQMQGIVTGTAVALGYGIGRGRGVGGAADRHSLAGRAVRAARLRRRSACGADERCR